MKSINLAPLGLTPLRVIGTGSDGVVVQAINSANEQLAVKFVSIQGRREKEFDKEALIAVALNGHPHIVKSKSYSKLSSEYGVIVMEYVGQDLMSYFLSKGKFTERKTKKIFHKMCLAVYHCHAVSIAHLDIKPDNFLYNPRTKALKLCDFHRSMHWQIGKVKSSIVAGVTSVRYRAPEQQFKSQKKIKSLRCYDKIDVWSLGVCLFGFLYAVFPFNLVNNDAEVNYDPAHLLRYLHHPGYPVSSSAKELILHMLHPEPALRYSMEDVISHNFFI